ncbi:MAG: phosphoserine transaminase, partial [Acidimicrobiales bacterium]
MATIEIPKDLLPADGRFGCGPSKVRPEALAAVLAAGSSLVGTSHRQAPVRNVVRRCREGLAQLLRLPGGYEIALGVGGSTAFFDLATFCLIEARSQHCSFGEFSSKFAAAAGAAPQIGQPTILATEPGTHPDPVAEDGIDAYALTHNETSTGVMMPLERPRRPDGTPAEGLVLVDATSGAGGLRFDPAEVDAYYFAPQKCLGSDGGLWLAALSPAAVERAERLKASGRFIPAFLDLTVAVQNSRLQQTYNTPAVVTLVLLADQVEWLNERGGLEWAASRSDRSAEHLYGWAERSDFATPFVAKPDDRSHVVGTIDLAGEIDAPAVAAVLRANGIVDTEPYRKLGRNQLRIAMFPAIDPEDVAALCGCITYIVGALADGQSPD